MDKLYTLLAEFHIGTTPRAILLVLLGFFVARGLSKLINNSFNKRLSLHQATLLRRFTFYLILTLFAISAVQELGFHLSALLGATGILTIAVGIASQTSLSNIISGIFIIGEKPFEIGDTIKVNDMQGEVLAIDLLSVRIRTNDNTMVRIPNETLTESGDRQHLLLSHPAPGSRPICLLSRQPRLDSQDPAQRCHRGAPLPC